MVEWKGHVAEAESNDEPRPQVTNYIGECFLKIANHLSYRPNFINYTYRDEMISDGIENCLQYIDNFNPEKSKNPFAYFTQIIYFAFVRRITKEKKQSKIKDAILKRSNIEDMIITQEHDDPSEYQRQYLDYLGKYSFGSDDKD
jgi:DNA-directed RNA polymerase specialized sigma24 family protein